MSPSGSYAEPLVLKTGSQQTALLELFTSEGCASCPPAEEWLSSLKNARGLWKDFAPVQFHVDYWDRLGWKDKWASREFSDRQYAYSEIWQAKGVYTPGFVLNGGEWKAPTGKGQGPANPYAKPVGVLTVRQGARWEFNVEFRPLEVETRYWEVNAALLGMGIQSSVMAGENRGKILDHDFVVLEYQKKKMSDGLEQFSTAIFFQSEDKQAKRYAVVFWVTKNEEIFPIQTTGGYLPD